MYINPIAFGVTVGVFGTLIVEIIACVAYVLSQDGKNEKH